MDRRVRILLAVVAVTQAVLAVLWVFQVPAAIGLWPFPGRTPLSNIFIGSIFLAAAASTGWCLWARSDRAMTGIALDYITILVPFTIFSFAQVADGAGTDVVAFGVVCVAGVLVGGALVVGVPAILPWTITPELSTLFGCMFLGAAAYFAYGLLDPRWENAGGQLAGFLAYDIVLIVPFLTRLPTVDEKLRINLVVYTAVVTLSAVLAVWYLAIHPGTRIWPRPAGSDRPPD